MEEEEAGSPSAAAVVLPLVVLVVVPGLALLAQSRWRRAAARREEVRRLTRLAAEESDLAERESALAYYSELFPNVVHAAEVPEAPVWGLTPVVALAQEDVEAQPQPQPPAGAKGVCAVCFRPTFWCKQCKAVSTGNSGDARAIEHDKYKVIDKLNNRLLEEIEESKAFFQGSLNIFLLLAKLTDKLMDTCRAL